MKSKNILLHYCRKRKRQNLIKYSQIFTNINAFLYHNKAKLNKLRRIYNSMEEPILPSQKIIYDFAVIIFPNNQLNNALNTKA